MGFHETRFPDDISYGSSGGPGFRTTIIETDSGAEQRVAHWNAPRRQFNVSYGVKSYSQLVIVQEFYIARQGAAYGFRYKDWLDFSTAADHRAAPAFDDEEIAVGDGTTTQFQLLKTYTGGGITRTRNLTKPVSGTTKIGIDDVEQVSGWSVNTTTGIVTFSVAPGDGEVIQAGCEFDVPVRFSKEADDLLHMTLEDYDNGRIDGLVLVELREEDDLQDEFLFGGAKPHGNVSASFSITLLEGRTHTFAPTGPNLKLYLPTITPIPAGGPHFFLVNQSGTYSIDVQYGGSTIVAVGPSSAKTICIYEDSGATKHYFAL